MVPQQNILLIYDVQKVQSTKRSTLENKQQFINLLSSRLSKKGCKTFHASGDADTLIVQTAFSCAANGGHYVVLVGGRYRSSCSPLLPCRYDSPKYLFQV